MGQLNELQIKAAQPRDKEYLLADGEGLYLRVRPTGKAWVYRYKEARKEAKLPSGLRSGAQMPCRQRPSSPTGGGNKSVLSVIAVFVVVAGVLAIGQIVRSF